MKYYIGIDRKTFVDYVEHPMFSVRILMNRKSKVVTNGKEWFLDSGAFTYLKQYGKFPFTIGKYLNVVSRQKPNHWACMDWCCEPTVQKVTGLNVLQHIGNTVENGRQLIDFDKDHFVMVLQGWDVRDYLTCLDYVRDYDLITPTMGVGTICGRTDKKEVFNILKSLKAELPDYVRLHCFGLSINLLKYKEIFDRVDSIDTFAWSREFGLSILNGVTKEMRIKAICNYNRKLSDLNDKNLNQNVLI